MDSSNSERATRRLMIRPINYLGAGGQENKSRGGMGLKTSMTTLAYQISHLPVHNQRFNHNIWQIT